MATKKDSKKIKLPKEIEALPKEAQKKYEDLQKKLDSFREKILSKFEDYIVGISLFPPNKSDKNSDSDDEKSKNPDAINVFVLVDDTDSKKMSKEDLKNKLSTIILEQAKSVDKNLTPEVMLLTELWQYCYDGKTEILRSIATSAIIYEKGMLSAIKISEVHKDMILKKFEKYIVAYVLAGSLVQGRATPESDIDVFIVIDDTDVKKMTRFELRDKLRMIISGMGLEAGEITGIKNKLNIQVYILTDFWDSVKEANPVIFTFLRDGIPFYDRGIFMPWKQLLQMGKIKPSAEAIQMYMTTGDQMIERAKFKLKDIAMEDLFWATLPPSQAALMLMGIPPPTPKETPHVLRDLLVKKEKIFEEKWVKILEANLSVRKQLEHGTKTQVSGKEVDKLLSDSEQYLKRIGVLFEELTKFKDKEMLTSQYENITSLIRDALKVEDVKKKISKTEIPNLFETELVQSGKIPERFARLLKEFIKIKNKSSLTKLDLKKANQNSTELVKTLIDFIQMKQVRNVEQSKFRIIVKEKDRDKNAELLFTKNAIFLLITEEDKKVSKYDLKSEKFVKSSIEEYEKALENSKDFVKPKLATKFLERLKDYLKCDFEVLV